jgi:hypothetical protein
LESGQRVNGGSSEPHFEVKMRAGRISGRTDETDCRARCDVLSKLDAALGEVCVHRANAVGVSERYNQPPSDAHAGPHDTTSRRRPNRRSQRFSEIHAGVKAIASRPEPVAHRTGYRPAQRYRRNGEWCTKGCQSVLPRDAVWSECCEDLETPQGTVEVCAEPAIEGTGRESVTRQRELKLSDVPSSLAQCQRARSESPRNEDSEKRSSALSERAVRLQAVSALEAANSFNGRRATDPIDGTTIEPFRP